MALTQSLMMMLTICVGSALFVAQKTEVGSSNKPEEQVKQLEREWLTADAKGDAATLRRIISDDFIGSSFDGGVLFKDDIIPQGSGPGGFAGATPNEPTVRIFGDTAVLMGSINAGGAGTSKVRVSLVCQKRTEGWQIISTQLAH